MKGPFNAKQAHEARPWDVPMEITTQAPGAWPNGTRVRKSRMEDGDTNPIGTLATVTGSVGPMPPGGPKPGTFGYFVRWDPRPHLPVFVHESKVERLP